MRFKTTMKEVKATSRIILKVGYCDLATVNNLKKFTAKK